MYVHIYIYVCICIYMYTHTHIFFIHPSVDGHLGSFCILTIVNSAAVNAWAVGYMCLFELVFSLSDAYPTVELLDGVLVLLLVF